eukprot:4514454-Pyramimonas_sp.AAC.2
MPVMRYSTARSGLLKAARIARNTWGEGWSWIQNRPDAVVVHFNGVKMTRHVTLPKQVIISTQNLRIGAILTSGGTSGSEVSCNV